MTQTDRILSNIGAIRTLLENFPMGLFERDGKTYVSSFEFIMDVLRSCGINDQYLVSYLIGKIYGFEGKPGYTINGLYENIKRGNINIDMQNPFISGLETSIKAILMSLFTSFYTCSALPILPNKVFDYDSLYCLMTDAVKNITEQNDANDRDYKLKVPVSVIDMIGMFSISPSSSDGTLYYSTSGCDIYYHKEFVKTSGYTYVSKRLNAGDEYEASVKKYKNDYYVDFNYDNDCNVFFKLFDTYTGQIVERGIPIDLRISVDYTYGDSDTIMHRTLMIPKGENQSGKFILYPDYEDGEISVKSKIFGISINGNKKECEFGTEDEGKSWIYVKSTSGSENWEERGGIIDSDVFGETKSDVTIIKKFIAENSDIYTGCAVSSVTNILTYVEIPNPSKNEISKSIRYAYVPTNVNDNDDEYIVWYKGTNPNLAYREYDMNAFLWYCYNRFNFSNQIERNHLMWDSRISASKNGIERNASEWSAWYASKHEEGAEFEYNSNPNSEIFYPIIQVEKYNDDEFLIRIPAQRYFLPKKREQIYDNTYTTGGVYFNASIYRFDWDYLKNIQLLNPKLMLVRLIEHLLGFALDMASNVQFNVNKKRIEAVLSKVVKSIIEANDMEVEDCWKSFSNEDYNDLLNEMVLSRYMASGTSGKTDMYDAREYINKLDKINSNITSQGTTTMITKTVTDVMMNDGSEASTEYSFDYGFKSNIMSRLIWAITMPIVESLFTPQVMLLMMVNFQLLGVVNTNEVPSLGNDFGKVLNLLLNKIFGLVKSIVIFIKDKIVALLLDLFETIITPILNNMMLMLYLEMITDWLIILLNAVKCIPLMLGFNRNSPIGYIEDVDYADIVNVQNIPESSSEC